MPSRHVPPLVNGKQEKAGIHVTIEQVLVERWRRLNPNLPIRKIGDRVNRIVELFLAEEETKRFALDS